MRRMPSDKDINDLKDYITQLEGQVQDLLLIIGDADSGLVKAVNDLTGQCESLQEQINAIDVSGLDGRITTLEGYFDANGKAKKALEALKLKYSGGAIDTELGFNVLTEQWNVTGDANQFYAAYIYGVNINAMDDDIIDLKGYFNAGGVAKKAVQALKLIYESGAIDSSVEFDVMKEAWTVLNGLIADMPTSDPHEAGQLWNDSGTVKISAG